MLDYDCVRCSGSIGANAGIWHICRECYEEGWCYRCGENKMFERGEWCRKCRKQTQGLV